MPITEVGNIFLRDRLILKGPLYKGLFHSHLQGDKVSSGPPRNKRDVCPFSVGPVSDSHSSNSKQGNVEKIPHARV